MDKDKGFVSVPNRLYMAIITYGFTQIQMIVVLHIVRKTYGWRKQKDRIAISVIAKELNKKRQLISRTVSDLQKLSVIGIERSRNGVPPVMWIQDPKNWDKPETVEFQEPATEQFHTTYNTDTITDKTTEIPIDPSEDDDGEDPLVLWERIKHEYEHL